ncbi:MAG: Protein translocase subunit SecY, partial [uncultured Acidimicrobiales bacterium]
AVEPEEHLQGRGSSQQDPLHPVRDPAVPARVERHRAGHRLQRGAGPAAPGRRGRRPGLPEPLLRWRPHPDGGLRPRDHALHHQLDHHAAPGGGDPQDRAVAEAGRRRPEEDHPVDALHDRRPGRPPGHRHHLPVQQRPPRLGHRHRPSAGDHVRRAPRRPDRPHHHRGHGHRDVDGGADHPAGHRQRDVHPDLRQRGEPHAGPGRQYPGREGLLRLHHLHAAGRRDDRGHRVRRAGPTPHPRAVRQAGRRPADVRRPEHLHPPQGQPGRRHPDHLRQLRPLLPGVALQHHPVGGGGELHQQVPGAAGQHRLHPHLRPDDRVLHLLLHGHHVQPPATGGHHPQAGWVHPGHPPRASHRALPRSDPQPHHAARLTVPRRHRPGPEHPAVALRRPAVPVRRHHHPDRSRCGPGNDEADRQSAHDAELRGLPRL